MNEHELGDFYPRIGSAIWHVQYLEDTLVNFLCLKTVHERRCSGETVSMPDAEALIAEKRKLTLGPLIESCISRKIIKSEIRARFDAFKVERHWLVHRSMIESGDDLYHETTRDAVFEHDLTGLFCTSRSERQNTERDEGNAKEELYAGADRRQAAADRSAGEPGQDGAAGV